MKRQHSFSNWVLLKRFIGMLLNILTFFLIRNALKMFQTLLIPTAIPHRCSLSSFIGLYLSICPPPPALIYSFPILWKHTPSCARTPSALRFPAAPAASEIRQLALLKGVYTCSGHPRPRAWRLICMWMLAGGRYEMWTCNAAGVFGVCM